MHSEKSPVRSNQPADRGRHKDSGETQTRRKNSTSPSAPQKSTTAVRQRANHRPPNRRKKKDKETTAFKRSVSPAGSPEASVGGSVSVSDIHRVARQGDAEALLQQIARGNDVNAKVFGCTPLHWAAFEGRLKCVELLLKVPTIDVNSRELESRTPLALAARNGHLDCMKVLITAGADVNAKNKWEETPLSKVASYGHVGCLMWLLRYGAEIDCVDIWLETPLYKSAAKGHAECVRALLEEGSKFINSPNEMGFSPLHVAVTSGSLECVEMLLNYGANPEATDGNGKMPYKDAKERGYKGIMGTLEKAIMSRRRSQLEEKELNEWTVDEVARWVEAIGYEEYCENFRENHISGSMLQKVDMDVLRRELKIMSYGVRSRILDAVKNAMSPNSISVQKSIGSTIVTIDYSELQLYETLGKGYFGEVKRAVWNGTEVACKIIYRDSYRADFGLFEKEAIILSRMRHPNVIMILAVTSTPEGSHCIVTEYMSGGSLHRLIDSCFFMLETQPGLRYKIVSDMCKGMVYLHANKPPILHRDLSSYNILLDGNNITKVADFGLSHVKQESGDKKYAVGQIPWMAPEVLKNEFNYTEKADVYSFGCVLYELWTGKEPHHGIEPMKYGEMVQEGYRPELPTSVPERWRELIRDCMHPLSSERPHFRDILERLDWLASDTPPTSPSHAIYGGLSLGNGFSLLPNLNVGDDFDPCYLES